MTSSGAWKNRIKKFLDYPPALIPFLKKYAYYNFVCDRYLSAYTSMHFLDHQETIEYIIENNKSFVRFGDELIDMFHGIGLYYGDWHQRYDKTLARRLKEIVSSQDDRLLIGLHWQYFTKSISQLTADGIPAHIWTNSKVFLRNYIHKGYTYGSALCFQPKFNPELDLSRIAEYWKSKHIIVVTGNTKRLEGVSLGKTTTYVDCPRNDSWLVYESILERALSEALKIDNKENILFLVSLASPGKILTHDLVTAGYQAWDTGQLFDLALEKITQTTAREGRVGSCLE